MEASQSGSVRDKAGVTSSSAASSLAVVCRFWGGIREYLLWFSIDLVSRVVNIWSQLFKLHPQYEEERAEKQSVVNLLMDDVGLASLEREKRLCSIIIRYNKKLRYMFISANPSVRSEVQPNQSLKD